MNFKGYQAAPLKNIYLDKISSRPFVDEMMKMGKYENIDIKLFEDNRKWMQDDKIIVERDKKPFMLVRNKSGWLSLYCAQKNNIDGAEVKGHNFLTGGDTFLGKHANGKKWLMMGNVANSKLSDNDRKIISETYGVNLKNIYVIPNKNYHLDMFLRPLDNDTILVDDSALVKEKLAKLGEMYGHTPEYKELIENYEYYENERKMEFPYATDEGVVKALKDAGFKVVKIAGVYSQGANFMNAIVNKHADGTLGYVTNSSICDNAMYCEIQEIFETDLKDKVRNIDGIHFIRGKNNAIIDDLQYGGGGIHCMSLEEPNFSAWA